MRKMPSIRENVPGSREQRLRREGSRAEDMPICAQIAQLKCRRPCVHVSCPELASHERDGHRLRGSQINGACLRARSLPSVMLNVATMCVPSACCLKFVRLGNYMSVFNCLRCTLTMMLVMPDGPYRQRQAVDQSGSSLASVAGHSIYLSPQHLLSGRQ